jgi:hypothetical protein
MKFWQAVEKIVVLSLIAIGNTLLVYYICIFVLQLDRSLILILSYTVLIAILAFFWYRWSERLLVSLTGSIILLSSALFVALSPAQTSFPWNVILFPLYILLGPLLLIAPVLGPLTILYALFRNLLSNNRSAGATESDKTGQNSAPQITTKNKMIISAIIGVIILSIIAFPLYYIATSGSTDVPQPNHQDIGRTFRYNMSLAYVHDCTVCSDSKRAQEINRELECIDDIASLAPHHFKHGFINVSYVRSDMTFTVKEVFRNEKHGLAKLGGSDKDVVILEDENRVLSSTLLTFANSSLCLNYLPSHLDKLFRYTEQKGKSRILLTVYDVMNEKTEIQAQQELIKNLKSLPGGYSVDNIEPANSTIPDMLGVAADVDSDALAYLSVSTLDYDIWEITGLDQEYLQTLAAEDGLGIRSAPIGHGFETLNVTTLAACNDLAEPVEIGNCYAINGLKYANRDICFELSGNASRACFDYLSKRSNDMLFCYRIPSYYQDIQDSCALRLQQKGLSCATANSPPLRDQCFSESALRSMDISECEKITDTYSLELCLRLVALNVKNVSECDRITSDGIKASCYVHMAPVVDDPLLCEKANNQSRMELCYLEVSQKLQDRSLCKKITNPKLLQECLDY